MGNNKAVKYKKYKIIYVFTKKLKIGMLKLKLTEITVLKSNHPKTKPHRSTQTVLSGRV